MSKRVIGIYTDSRRAAEAFEQLGREGFPRGSVSILLSDTPAGRAFLEGERSRVVEAAFAGSAVGGALAGIAASTLTFPTVGIIAAGPIAAALGGLGLGAASGGLLGGLIGLGMPENQAALRSKEVQDGAILVSVEVDQDTAETAEALLRSTGAEQIVVAS